MENAPSVTDEMIMRYKNLVYKVYRTYYAKYFSYLEEDLIQCGYWGLFQAYEKYSADKNFMSFAYRHIRRKMWQYIDHEKHHITKEEPLDYKQPITKIHYNADLKRAISTLSQKDKLLLKDWLNNKRFEEMTEYNSRQMAHYHFNRIKKQLREQLQ